YQVSAKANVNAQWAAGHRVVCLRMPTGGGKTPTFASIMTDEPGASIVIAHRSELVSQSAMALARYGVRHRVIGPQSLVKLCSQIQIAE
ncbi:DEAD/DEAH box helicase family protein, partial [Streptomyces caeruleatus]